MHINQIDNIHQFNQLKPDWESVYAIDPHAHIFVSWMWLQGWFEITPFTWIVLAARPDEASPYVAFFPLNIRLLRIYKFNVIRELRMGSKPLGGYTGFVCLPEYEQETITAFATYLQERVDWDSFQMEHVLDPRLDLFLKFFSKDKFEVRSDSRIASTYIPLPDSWEQYLQNYLSIKPRQNLKRHIRQVENHHNLRMVHIQEDNLTSQIKAAQMLSQLKWDPKPVHIQNWTHDILRHCFKNDCLWLNMLWDGTTPVSARVALVDRQKKTAYDFFTGYDAEYAKLSPGTVILGYNIRGAIENKFHMYDFLMGEDEYKFVLGAKRRDDVITLVITRKNLRSITANLVLNLVRQLRDLLKKKL